MRYSIFPMTFIALALTACGEQETSQAPVPTAPAEEKTVLDTLKEQAAPVIEAVKEEAAPVIEQATVATGAATAAVADKATDAVSSVVDKAKEVATDAAVAVGLPVPIVDQHAPKAAAAIMTFATTLQGELKAAMSNGGAPNAISVCNEKAPAIASELSEKSGYNLGRVSLKNRNPEQEASGWKKGILEKFEERLAAGEDINTLVYKAVVDQEDGTQQFRMMKAIPTGKICLNCHGAEVAPEAEAKLSELYPDDKARGYEEGMIRGAFVVTKDL